MAVLQTLTASVVAKGSAVGKVVRAWKCEPLKSDSQVQLIRMCIFILVLMT